MTSGTTSRVLRFEGTRSNSSFDSIITGDIEKELSGNRTYESGTTAEPGLEYSNMYCEPIESIPLAIISGVVATATIIGNLLVILAILRGSSRLHRPMYWLIIHLSTADLIVGLMLLWNYCMASLLNIHNTLSSLMVVFCIWVTSEAASTIGFVLLAVDRYVQIFYKAFHRTYATRVTVGLAIFLTWVLSFTIFFLPAVAFGQSCKDSCECKAEKYMMCLPRTDCSQIIPPLRKSYSLAVGTMLFVCIPIPVVIYTMIFIKVRRKTQLIKHSHGRHDIRLMHTLAVILAVFIFTLSPVAFLAIVDYTMDHENNTMIDVAFYIFVLAFLNSLANPLLYMWRMAAIRRSIRQTIFFCFWPKNGQPTRRDLTSFQSDQRSPTINRQRNPDHHDNAENKKFITQNNNMPIAAALCLRQMKRGRYTTSRTSTPLSERANHHEPHDLEEAVNFTKDIENEHTVNHDEICVHDSIDKNCAGKVTEL